jgi:carboxylesterase type B
MTIAYRLGPLGFLALPELTRESPNGSSGNYGLMDQIAALQWIHRNLADFGGDPGRVTIAGQSSGSISVSILMASPRARAYFSVRSEKAADCLSRCNSHRATCWSMPNMTGRSMSLRLGRTLSRNCAGCPRQHSRT